MKTALLSTLITAFSIAYSFAQVPCDLDNTAPALPANPFFPENQDCNLFPGVTALNLEAAQIADISQLTQTSSIRNAYTLYDVEIIPAVADYKAIVLFTMTAEYKYYDMDQALLVELENNELALVAKVHNRMHPNGGLYVVFHFINGRNWADWSALGRSYKADINALPEEHPNWMYYEFGDSYAVGWGDMEGSSLAFTHAPASYFYGFQVGLGANNNSAEYGCGGWFNYSGSIVDNATEFSYNTGAVALAGDVTFNMIPEAISVVQSEFIALDACGNAASHTMYGPLCADGSPIMTNINVINNVATICDIVDFTPQWTTTCDDTEVAFTVDYTAAPANNGSTQVVVTATYSAITTCVDTPTIFTLQYVINPSEAQLCAIPGTSMDIDQNSIIGTNDIVLFMSTPSETMEYDFNLSGTQDVNDLLMIIQNFGNYSE